MSELEVTWSCRHHPTDWWHEVGCPHMEWTIEQLRDALIAKKRFEIESLPDWSFTKQQAKKESDEI